MKKSLINRKKNRSKMSKILRKNKRKSNKRSNRIQKSQNNLRDSQINSKENLPKTTLNLILTSQSQRQSKVVLSHQKKTTILHTNNLWNYQLRKQHWFQAWLHTRRL